MTVRRILQRGAPRARITKPELPWLEQTENKEKLVSLLGAYQRLRYTVWTFINTTDPKDRSGLNREYMRLLKRVINLFHELKLGKEDGGTITLQHFYIPSDRLLGAEMEFREHGDTFSEDIVMPAMEATEGAIKYLFEAAGAATTHPPMDIRKHMEQVDRVLSEMERKSRQIEMPSEKKEVNITYSKGVGKLTFGDTGSVVFEGYQKDLLDCLIDKGKEVKKSWDEVCEAFGDEFDSADAAKRAVRNAMREINRNTAKHLPSGEKLIDAKANEYWLQYKVKVDKGK